MLEDMLNDGTGTLRGHRVEPFQNVLRDFYHDATR